MHLGLGVYVLFCICYATSSLRARSVESGLLTVALRAKDAYSGRAESAGAALEIEDLASLYLRVTGDAAYAQISAALAAAGGGASAS